MSEQVVKVAVASKHGVAVDEHFGHAKRFWIYAVTEDGCELLEQREVDNYCQGNTSSKPAMTRILQTIDDCEAVLVAKIGDGPADKLAAIGVTAVSDYPWSPVDEALLAYLRDRGQ
jgi:predicted Fe-Mo cluster-binding NifX family protein